MGKNGMLFTQEGEPISAVTKGSEKYVQADFHQITGGKFPCVKVLRQKPIHGTKDIRTRKSVFPLVGLWSKNYYHWFAEYLPRIREFECVISNCENRPTLLLPNDPPDWLLSSLRHVGVDISNCSEWNNDVEIAQELFLSSHRVKTGGHYNIYDLSADDCYWIKERITSNLDKPVGSHHSPRIYISRQEAESRKVANFTQIEATLRDFGFEIYQLEDLSFEDQVRLFWGAEVIVGPHGSGLVNMLFAPEDTRVVELLPEAENNAHYFRLSQILNHEYHHVLCEEKSQDMFLKNDSLVSKLSSVV